ncbi:MAG: PHP domain-containing protein, partial [Myxococcota bacterium]
MPFSSSDYVELRCQSAFTFLEAASNPEDLADRAAELGYPAVALGDVGGIYGIPRFHRAASDAGLRAIVGAQIFVADPNAPAPLLLLVETQRGYANLCRILTESHRHVAKGESLNRWEEIEECAEGLTALARGDASLRTSVLDRANAIFGRDRLWVDVSRHLDRATEAAGRRAVALAEAARVPVVATNDVCHARPEGRQLFDALTCLRWKTSLDRAGRHLAVNAERHLRSPREMAEWFVGRPAWIRATREVSERCAFGLENLGYRFPLYPVPIGETQASYLRHLT